MRKKRISFSHSKVKECLTCITVIIINQEQLKNESDFISYFELSLHRLQLTTLSNVNYYLLRGVRDAPRARRYDDEASLFHGMRNRLSALCSGSIVKREYVSVLFQHKHFAIDTLPWKSENCYHYFHQELFLLNMQINRGYYHENSHFLKERDSCFFRSH